MNVGDVYPSAVRLDLARCCTTAYTRPAFRTDAFVIRQPAQDVSHASLSDPFERSCTSLALSYACIPIEDIKTIAPTTKQPGP